MKRRMKSTFVSAIIYCWILSVFFLMLSHFWRNRRLFQFSRCVSLSVSHTLPHTQSGGVGGGGGGVTGLFTVFKLHLGSSLNSFPLISFPVVAFSKANRSQVFYLTDFPLTHSLSPSLCSLPPLSLSLSLS